jgi:heat shock protein 1/8
LIGRRFEDETVKKDVQSWPFKVVDQNGSPMIEVSYLGETKQFSAQEISAMVLVKVRHVHSFFRRAFANTSADEGGC